jgi:thioredoxin 1
VIKITKENFTNEILESKVPVVLGAFASWCIPCKAVASIFSELSPDLQGKVKLAKFDIEEELTLAQDFKVHAMLTLSFF